MTEADRGGRPVPAAAEGSAPMRQDSAAALGSLDLRLTGAPNPRPGNQPS
jgi:hypothetical protein